MLPLALKLELIAIQERKELICAVIAATNKAVRYEHGNTICPVCALLEIRSVLNVVGTDGAIRKCKCPVCDACIKAIGEIRQSPEVVTKIPAVHYKEVRAKTKKGRKNGNNR